MNDKAKVILITRNFPPMRGGMERLNFYIHQELSREYETYLVGPEGSEQFCPDTGKVVAIPALPVGRFLAMAFWRTLRLARRLRPQFIFAGSGVAAFPAVLAGRLAGVPVLTYLHGLDIVAAHPVYQRVFIPVIRQSTAWLVNSHYTRKAAMAAGITSEKIEILHPGTDLPDLSNLQEGKTFRELIQAGDRRILISVGRLTRRKGLLEFIENSLPEIVRHCPDVLLLIIGSSPRQAIAASKKPLEIEISAVVHKNGLDEHIKLLGNVDEQILAQAYSASQVHVFPVLELPGDVEGFGMVAIEASAYGVPTVAFAVGGIPDSVGSGAAGTLVRSGDYPALTAAVIQRLLDAEGAGEARIQARQHAERFGWPCFGESLRKICAAI
jgi:phosphatidylinositol alpha-1,6-mannosyltransferase